MRSSIFAVLLIACGENAPTAIDGAITDAGTDAFICQVQFGTAPDSQVCFSAMPTFGPITLPSVIDTGTSELCSPVVYPTACVIVADAFTIDGPVAAVSSAQLMAKRYPLILLARDSITITNAGSIDVSSSNTQIGAGSRVCNAEKGAGGTFGGIGGKGEVPSLPRQPITSLVAGCAGGEGSAISGPGGLGGLGGGAVALIAPSIVVDGIVNASGQGGAGCGPVNIHGGCGGGGGGSGGLIVLDAGRISGAGTLVANGGGGGSAEARYQIIGPAGATPDPLAPSVQAAGGDESRDGLGPIGGAGAAASIPEGKDGQSETTGPVVHLHYGAGGGGAGIVRIHGMSGFTGTISPPAD